MPAACSLDSSQRAAEPGSCCGLGHHVNMVQHKWDRGHTAHLCICSKAPMVSTITPVLHLLPLMVLSLGNQTLRTVMWLKQRVAGMGCYACCLMPQHVCVKESKLQVKADLQCQASRKLSMCNHIRTKKITGRHLKSSLCT